jgi:hypothetical protein
MNRVLLAPLAGALLAFPLVPGCDCDPEPVNDVVCDFTLQARDGDVVDFGRVVANEDTRSASFVVANTGTVPLNAFAVSFAGNGDHYAVDIPADFVVRPAEDETLVVVFAPTQVTTLDAELRVTHPDPGANGCPVRSLTLRGEGVGAPPVDAGFPDAGFADAGPGDDAGVVDAGFITPPDDGVVLPTDAVWRAYGGLEEARAGFAAVTLADGTVVVIGGYGENGAVVDSIERFDPRTGRARVVARLAQPRAEPGAVLLPDGSIAIVGGLGPRGTPVVVDTIELFQPATDAVVCPGSQAAGDGSCSANGVGLLEGKARIGPVVTALGGSRIAVAAGRRLDPTTNAEVPAADGEIVDLGSAAGASAVVNLPGIPARVGEARIVGADGAFVLVGGRNAAGQPLFDLVRFAGALATTATTLSTTLTSARVDAGVAVLDRGDALLLGGVGAGGALLGDALLLRDPFAATPVLEPQTVTFAPRAAPLVATLPGDVVLVTGGLPADTRSLGDDDSVLPLQSADVLVPFGTGFARFAAGNDLAAAHPGGVAVVVDDAGVTFVGGFATSPRRTPHPHAERYVLDDNAFASFGLMGPGAALCAAALPTSGAALLAVGGVDPHTGATSARTRAFDAENGLFVDASPLRAARRDHTATSIAADLVVVIGGRDATGAVLASASILDVDGADAALPVALRRARAGHTATLLPADAGLGDNVILVCGGVGAGGEPLDTCELFRAPDNPRAPTTFATASFTLVEGRMATGRVGHTTTVLDDGSVLLVGGGDVESAQVAADLFEPASSRIVRTGVPVRARREHGAIHLGGGRVLVVGGEIFDSGLVPTASAELYVRATSAFVAVEDMEEARVRPAAFLLADGAVLVAGGTRTLGQPGFPFVSVVESEVFQPGPTGVGTFEAIDLPLSYGRSDLLAVDVFGRAVVVGGTHRDGVLGTGDERRTPQHFVDMLEDATP